jgi:hypothetical protein
MPVYHWMNEYREYEYKKYSDWCDHTGYCTCSVYNEEIPAYWRSWHFGERTLLFDEDVFCLKENVIKLAFYATVHCTIVIAITRHRKNESSYTEDAIKLKKGLSVLCLCQEFEPSTTSFKIKKRSIAYNYDYASYHPPEPEVVPPICVLSLVEPVVEPEVCAFFVYPVDNPPTLMELCQAKLALLFKRDYEYKGLVPQLIVNSISCSFMQRVLLKFNLFGVNSEACMWSLNWVGHMAWPIHADDVFGRKTRSAIFRKRRDIGYKLEYEKYSSEYKNRIYREKMINYIPKKKYKLLYYAYTI